MKITPYLSFAGNCEEAFKTYEKVLGGKIVFMMRQGEAPEQSPECSSPELADKIMHACLQIGDQNIMGADAPPQYQTKAQGMCVSIMVEDPAEAHRIFKELSEGGSVMMPVTETFWSPAFGMWTDRFGTPWMVNGGAKEFEMPASAAAE